MRLPDVIALLALLSLVACGADGEPQPPAAPGVSFSGETKIGVVFP